ncbi:MAG: TRAP transporter large permease [Azospirillaceae bacterium]
MIAILGTLALFVLLAAGVPVGFAMAIVGTVGLYAIGGVSMAMGVLSTTPATVTSSYELITIPMFVLMAEFVILSGVADSMFRAAAMWFGRLPGGLAIATAAAGGGFGAISGSSTASAATLSATSIPAMIREGYEPKLACGVVAISGTLAMLIPPSVALVLYGIIADVSIARLLVGGIIPGILVFLTIALTILALVAVDPSRGPRSARYTLRERVASLKVAGPVLLLLICVTGVIYLGVATPTEASGIGAFGAFLLVIAYRKLTAQSAYKALISAARTTCMIFMIILGAKIFGYFFTLTRATNEIVGFIAALETSPELILVCILLLYLILGFFMDQIAILILTVPIVLPVVLSLGYDPVWFGVIVIVIAELGLVTPPLGLNVFVVGRYTGRPLGEIFHGVVPHIIAHIALIIVLVAFPQIILWLPSTMR